MRKLRIPIVSVAALFGVITAVGYALPTHLRVERSISVKASTTVLYALIANLKNGWSRWRPFHDEDPHMKLAYSGPDIGRGATETWTSKRIGSGKLTITNADPKTGVELSLNIGDGDFLAAGSLLYQQNGDATTVTMTDDFDFGANPYKRYLGLFWGDSVGREFERGLKMLKEQCELDQGKGVDGGHV